MCYCILCLILAITFIQFMFGICLVAKSLFKSPSVTPSMWRTLNPTQKPSFEPSSQPSGNILTVQSIGVTDHKKQLHPLQIFIKSSHFLKFHWILDSSFYQTQVSDCMYITDVCLKVGACSFFFGAWDKEKKETSYICPLMKTT